MICSSLILLPERSSQIEQTCTILISNKHLQTRHGDLCVKNPPIKRDDLSHRNALAHSWRKGKEPSGSSKTLESRKAPVYEAAKKTIDHLLLKRLYRAFAREAPRN